MFHVPSLIALLTLCTTAAQDGASGDAARLVPADAFLVLRVESAESLHALATRFARLGGEEPPGDVGAMLAELDLPGDTGQIDLARPAFFALSLSGGSAVPTFVVPTRDAQAYATSLEGAAEFHAAALGGYVGVSQRAGYAAAGEPSAVLGALRPGLISARVDLASLIRTYRPLIEMGLGQFERMMDEADLEQEAGMDVAALMEVYFDAIWAFVDSADQLDLAFDFDGKVAQKRVWLTTLADSPMAKLGGAQTYDLRPAAGWIDPDAAFGVLMACDLAAMLQRFEPMMDAVLDAYPAELAADLRSMLERQRSILPLMGPLLAASGDLGAEGMRASYRVASPKASELSEAMRAALAGLAAGEATKSFGVEAPQEAQLGGARVLRSRVTIDAESLSALAGGMQDVDAAQMEQMQALLKSLYGANGVQLVWRTQGEGLTLALGGDDAFAASVLGAAPRAWADLPAELRSAVESASGGSLGLVYRIDYARIVSEMAPLFAGMGVGELGDFAGADLRMPVTLWMGVASTTWSGGAALDMDQLEAVVAAIRSMEAADAGATDEEDR
jgi:hypothetical protein